LGIVFEKDMNIISDKIMVGWLSYVNKDNIDRRHDIFETSIESLINLKDQPTYIVNFDNNSSTEIKDRILNSNIFDKCIHFKDNFLDISVLLGVPYLANKMGFKYCMYMYDDFTIFNNDFVNDTVSFLNNNEDVHCVRVTEYSYSKMNEYDSRIIPKNKNPDSIRHYNTVTGNKLSWSDPIHVGKSVFYKNNWHYTSRPTVWRTDVLLSIFENIDEIPVMQPFEGYACKELQNIPLVTGVLDFGAMNTFKQSERMITKKQIGKGKPARSISSKISKDLFIKLLMELT